MNAQHQYAGRVATRHYEEVSAMEEAAELFGWSILPWNDFTSRADQFSTFLNPDEGEPGRPDEDLIDDATNQRDNFRSLYQAARRLGVDAAPFNRAASQADDILAALKALAQEGS